MVKHTQTIRRQRLIKCLSVFDHFVGLAFKGLRITEKGIVVQGMHLERIRTSKMDLFCETSQWLKAVNFFAKKLHR